VAQAGQGSSPTIDMTVSSLAGCLDIIAQHYASIAEAAARHAAENAAASTPSSLLSRLAEAAHACLKTASVLQAGGRWTPDALGQLLGLSSPLKALAQWHSVSKKLNYALYALGGDEEAFLVILHALAAVAGVPEEQLQSAVDLGLFEGFSIVLAPLNETAASVLLPVDAAGLERLLHHGTPKPDEAAKLGALLEAAKSEEDLEQRQRRRLELLSHLPPGVCFNLECAAPLGAGDASGHLKVCSSCRIARYCSPLCFKYDWKHGHKGPCRAIQCERDG
jgi:hypothetical protein